jgi:FkbM family methyltransferase
MCSVVAAVDPVRGPAVGLARGLGLARSLVIYYGRPWRLRAQSRLYGEFVGPGDLAFDIGAHVGNRTRALRRLGARVIALEPQPRLARLLARQFAGDPAVTVVAAAVGAAPGSATLHASRRTPTVATLSPGWIERVRHAPSFAGVRWPDRHEVPVTTLDALIARHGRPRFCKIDVEGFEAEVLRGLSQPLPALSLEYVPAAIEVAQAAVARLLELGSYRFNVTPGERLRWLWPEWRGGREIAAWLAARVPGAPSGDVYARLETQG